MRQKRRGRRHGSSRILTGRQVKAICKTLVDKGPAQIKMPLAVRTGPALAIWILRRYGIQIPYRAMRLKPQRRG